MQKVTTKKFAEMCGVSDANIRGLISSGRLVAQKEGNGYCLDLDVKENLEYYDKRKNINNSNAISYANIAKEGTQVSNDIIARLASQIEELTQLSQKAGKAELLESNLIEKQNDIKYWQDLYFELQKTCESLRKDIHQKEKEIIQLEYKLESLQGNENKELTGAKEKISQLENQLLTNKNKRWWNVKII